MSEETNVKKAAIALDRYKIKRFRSVLRQNGYESELGDGLSKDTAFLYVTFHVDKFEELQKLLKRLNQEAAHRN